MPAPPGPAAPALPRLGHDEGAAVEVGLRAALHDEHDLAVPFVGAGDERDDPGVLRELARKRPEGGEIVERACERQNVRPRRGW